MNCLVNKRIFGGVVIGVALICGGFYSFYDKQTESNHQEMVMSYNTPVSNEISKKEAKKITQNFFAELAEDKNTVDSIIDCETYRKFISTDNNDSNKIFDAKIATLKKELSKHKNSIDMIDIMNVTQVDDILIVDYFWNNEKGELYFSKKNEKWQAIPFGIKNITPVKGTVVTQGYLPLKISGNIADTYDGKQRVFLFFGTMETVLASWESHFPLEVVLENEDGSETSVSIHKMDLERMSKFSFISDRPMYIEFNTKVEGKIKSISFNNLFVKNNMENYKKRDLNNNIKIDIEY